MTLSIEKRRAGLAADNRKFLLHTPGVGAACVAAGAGPATLVLHLTGKP